MEWRNILNIFFHIFFSVFACFYSVHPFVTCFRSDYAKKNWLNDFWVLSLRLEHFYFYFHCINLSFQADWIRQLRKYTVPVMLSIKKTEKFKSFISNATGLANRYDTKSLMGMRLRIHRTVGYILEPIRRFVCAQN